MDLELAFSDLALTEKRLKRIEESLKGAKASERDILLTEQNLIAKIKSALEGEIPLRKQELSRDEAKMIENTLAGPYRNRSNQQFLDFLASKFWTDESRTRMFGVTVSNGAYEKHISPDGTTEEPSKTESRFMAGEVIDLVGAGDSFRAGFISYVAKNLDAFRNGNMNFSQAIQMGNLFAALYIKAPLDDRYGNIRSYEKMFKSVRGSQ